MSRKNSVQTRLVHHATGHMQPGLKLKTVNPPVFRGSTFLYEDYDDVRAWKNRAAQTGRSGYGRSGNDLTVALESLIADLDGGTEAIATSCGMSAIALALTAFVQTGDQVLIADNLYEPGRAYADKVLARFGVTITYFNPLDLSNLESLLTDTAKVIYFEVPGSLTFEMPDCAAIYDFARKHDLISIVDTTWPTSVYYPAIERGADVSVAAGTKYYVGHSDAFFGIVVGNERTATTLRKQAALMGNHMGPDDVYLALRGMRTLKVRLDAVSNYALEVAEFLDAHPKVASVRHPALPNCPGHENWKAQFDGATGLFSFFLDAPYGGDAGEKMIEALTLFGIGFSWGGYESLAIHATPKAARTATNWDEESKGMGALIRVQIGLEDPKDLIADLSQALDLI